MIEDVNAMLAAWADGFGRGDGAAIAELYTEDALFIGGVGGCRLGQQGVAGYFAEHPGPAKVAFRDVVVRPLSNDIVLVAMIGAISTASAPEPRDFRFIQTHVRTADGWRIAGHHGSYSL